MKNVLTVALIATSTPFAATAAELSHTYVEGGYMHHVEDMPAFIRDDLDFNGGYVRGSVALRDNLYVFGGYQRGTNDDFGFSLGENRSQLGIGYNVGLTDRTEFIAELGYLHREFENSNYDLDGGRVSAGLRGQLGQRIEGWAKASYTDGDSSDGHYSGQLGALVKLNSRWGVTGEVDVESDSSRYTLGVRASF